MPDAPARILVVDDDPNVAEVVSRYLEREGFSVTTVGDGRQALDLALGNPPDLVVLDLMLPGMDGLEVCRRLRALAPVPVIMLTARGHKLLPSELAQTNIRHVVPKPFSARFVLGLVREVLAEWGGDDAAVAQERAA